jgi:hypothetical protein
MMMASECHKSYLQQDASKRITCRQAFRSVRQRVAYKAWRINQCSSTTFPSRSTARFSIGLHADMKLQVG